MPETTKVLEVKSVAEVTPKVEMPETTKVLEVKSVAEVTPKVEMPETTKVLEVKSVAEVTPKVEIPETYKDVTDAMPPITFFAVVAVPANSPIKVAAVTVPIK